MIAIGLFEGTETEVVNVDPFSLTRFTGTSVGAPLPDIVTLSVSVPLPTSGGQSRENVTVVVTLAGNSPEYRFGPVAVHQG